MGLLFTWPIGFVCWRLTGISSCRLTPEFVLGSQQTDPGHHAQRPSCCPKFTFCSTCLHLFAFFLAMLALSFYRTGICGPISHPSRYARPRLVQSQDRSLCMCTHPFYANHAIVPRSVYEVDAEEVQNYATKNVIGKCSLGRYGGEVGLVGFGRLDA